MTSSTSLNFPLNAVCESCGSAAMTALWCENSLPNLRTQCVTISENPMSYDRSEFNATS